MIFEQSHSFWIDPAPKALVPPMAPRGSSFGLSQAATEPLTGRSIVHALHPVSLGELLRREQPLEVYRQFESILLYGMYPEVFAYPDAAGKAEYLISLRNSYLYREILTLEQIKSSRKLRDIVTLLAIQIGSEVSLNEIANTVGLARNTVERYIELALSVGAGGTCRRVGPPCSRA